MNTCFADDICIEDYSSTIIENKNGSNVCFQAQVNKKSPNNLPKAKKHALQNSEVEEPLKKKKKLSKGTDTASVILNSAAHNSPVAILNKIIQNLNYRIVSQSGPSHCAKFTISVQVNGQHFTGTGSSKKAAKAAAAYKALTAMKHPVTESIPPCDFASDEDLSSSSFTKDGKNFEDSLVNCGDSANNAISAAPLVVKSASLVASKSPINIIYESYPDAIFHCTSVEFGTDSDNRRYKVICEISGQKFEGHGSSKKSAKLGACKSAIAALGNPNSHNIARTENSLPKYSPNVVPPISSGLPQTLADLISKLVIDKFNDLLQSDPIHIRRKVLAGIVMTYGNNYEHVEVLTVSSGTKCVSGDRLSTSGLVVNDCHAEVVSRRCFQDFLYGCLEEIAATPDGVVGDSNPLRPAAGGGYQLKETYRFHLYISTAPCGDARIFSPHEEACLPPDRHPNRQARGQLRTKIESGEGTIPVKSSGGIQTWDGVLLGERLLTMSCSDKVCRWNVLGVQGALLSLFLPPLYLQSIVLGSLLHPHHLNRAVCGRLMGVLKDLAPPFHINRPLLAQSSSAEQRNAMRAPSFSVNWTRGQQAKEVINAVTGKTELGKPSRLCKQNMFRRWTQLVPQLSAMPQAVSPSAPAPASTAAPALEENLSSIGYDLAKSKALLYQNSKLSLFKAFQKANLGNWLKKPIEQDQFHKVDCDNN